MSALMSGLVFRPVFFDLLAIDVFNKYNEIGQSLYDPDATIANEQKELR